MVRKISHDICFSKILLITTHNTHTTFFSATDTTQTKKLLSQIIFKVINTMPRGPRIILTPKSLRKLNFIDPNHPRLRRHVIARIILSEYRRCNIIDVIHHSKSKSTVPPLFRAILKSFESRFLNQTSDLTITPIYLWRIHVREYLPSKMDPNHHVIYFKHRFQEKKNNLHIQFVGRTSPSKTCHPLPRFSKTATQYFTMPQTYTAHPTVLCKSTTYPHSIQT